MSEFYTRLFVDSSASLQTLLARLAVATSGAIDEGTLVAAPFELDVRRNEFARERDIESAEGDFMFFPYSVEIVADPRAADEMRYVAFVELVMRTLHAGGMTVVAACDWEDKLPGCGRLDAADGPDPG
jgi:hypothetical protein